VTIDYKSMEINPKSKRGQPILNVLNNRGVSGEQHHAGGVLPMIEQLYREYGNRMVAYASKLMHSKTLAMDIVQDVFVDLSKHEKKLILMEETGRKAYILISVRHRCFKEAAKFENSARIFSFDEAIHGNDETKITDPADLLDKKIENNALHNAVDLLSVKYKDVIVLRYFCGLSYREIGETLNITAANARTIAKRARGELKEAIESLEIGEVDK